MVFPQGTQVFSGGIESDSNLPLLGVLASVFASLPSALKRAK